MLTCVGGELGDGGAEGLEVHGVGGGRQAALGAVARRARGVPQRVQRARPRQARAAPARRVVGALEAQDGVSERVARLRARAPQHGARTAQRGGDVAEGGQAAPLHRLLQRRARSRQLHVLAAVVYTYRLTLHSAYKLPQ